VAGWLSGSGQCYPCHPLDDHGATVSAGTDNHRLAYPGDRKLFSFGSGVWRMGGYGDTLLNSMISLNSPPLRGTTMSNPYSAVTALARPRVRQIVIAAALMSTVALGQSGIASADREWDIAAYDDCLQNTAQTTDVCCIRSGGDLGPEPNTCQAPPAVQDGSNRVPPTKQPRPTKAAPIPVPVLQVG
jgi:hypothetical protein